LLLCTLITHIDSKAVSNIPKNTPQSSPKPWKEGLKNGLASALAAACVKLTLQPIDAMKTVQQYSNNKYTLWQAARLLHKNGNFYAGVGVTVLGSMPSVALYFGVYDYCKRQLPIKQRLPRVALAAAVGNTVASFSRVPYEVVKQQLQTGQFGTVWQVLQQPALLRALFPPGGVASQMIRDVPYAVVTLLAYESLQSWVQQHQGTSSRLKDFTVGGAAGGLGSLVTTPMDVIKTRMQTSQCVSIGDCVAQVVREGAYMRGCWPRLLHKVPANSFFFLFYELFRRVLRVDTSERKR